jgi:hypothetical protein
MATVTPGITFISGETVTPAKLNAAAAPSVAVTDNEITTSKILDANVTAAKLAATLDLSSKTVTLPDDSVTNDKLSLAANAGEVKKALNADNAPPIYACRAWVSFDGTRNEADTGASTNGANVKIRASGNVASVRKNSAGDYTITFTTAMPDANYCVNLSATDNGTTAGLSNGFAYGTWLRGPNSTGYAAGSLRIQIGFPSNSSLHDQTHVNVAIFR